MGGKNYGVVVRIITELQPNGKPTAVFKAGVKRLMAAIRVDGVPVEVSIVPVGTTHLDLSRFR